MIIEPNSKMIEFARISDGELFMTFIDDTQVFGMKTKLGNEPAVLHMNGGAPKVVDQNHFANRDVLLLQSVIFQFPDINKAKTGNPDTYAYGSAILSSEGTFIRASNESGPYDVNLGNGAMGLSRSHPGSIWFDAWEVALTRVGKTEILFAHRTQKTTRTPG